MHERPLPKRLEGRRDELFAILSPAQLARVAAVATEQRFGDGDVLYAPGDVGVPMFVLLDGAIDIFDHEGSEMIVSFARGGFTGEVNLLRGGPALVEARARGPTRVLRLEQVALQALLQRDSEIGDILLRAFILRRAGLIEASAGDLILVGSRYSADTARIQAFLVQNVQPFRYLDIERREDVQALLDAFHVSVADVPVLICRDHVLRNPTEAEVAECLGFNPVLEPSVVHDVVICGAGPGGLAAAVYAASEGLDVLVLEAQSPGGQAAGSSNIENYLGFPTGISGGTLMTRAFAQAEKFGAKVAVATSATRILDQRGTYRIELSNGRCVVARTVVIATGVRYRKLDVPDRARFEGVGVYYAATELEARRVGSDDAIVVGGANSAGQAATYLARACRHVHVLIRGDGLAAHMSRYLISRIEATPNIELHLRTQVVGLEGSEHLDRVAWRDETGTTSAHDIRHVFSMTGADPQTHWLADFVATDAKGFIITGSELTDAQLAAAGWPKARRPLLFETSRPGVFAVGDVRASRTKRIASSVGEGSVCVQLVQQVLDE